MKTIPLVIIIKIRIVKFRLKKVRIRNLQVYWQFKVRNGRATVYPLILLLEVIILTFSKQQTDTFVDLIKFANL